MISVEEALEKILGYVGVLEPEEVPILSALGQVLAEDVGAAGGGRGGGGVLLPGGGGARHRRSHHDGRPHTQRGRCRRPLRGDRRGGSAAAPGGASCRVHGG